MRPPSGLKALHSVGLRAPHSVGLRAPHSVGLRADSPRDAGGGLGEGHLKGGCSVGKEVSGE